MQTDSSSAVKKGAFSFAHQLMGGRVVPDIPDFCRELVAECCQRGEDYKVQGSILYKEYSSWCKDNGFIPKNAKNAAEDWERLGFQRKRAKGRSFWHGLRVVPIVLADDMRAQEKAG